MSRVLSVLGCGILCFFAQARASDNAAAPGGILYSTTLINSDTNSAPPQVSAIALDAAGNSYVAGFIKSGGLATTPGVVQPLYAGGSCRGNNEIVSYPCEDGFIAKFDSQGRLVFLTYLGGTGSDLAQSIAVDSTGNIYVAGITTSKDFPLAGNPWRPVLSGPGGAFVAKLSADGRALIYSTVVNWTVTSMATDSEGDVYFVTQTYSGQVFVNLTKLGPDGSLVSNLSEPPGTNTVAVGYDDSVFIGGSTSGTDIAATDGAWQSVFGGGASDAFIAKLDADLVHRAWITFLGGNDTDYVTAIQPDRSGNIWVAGATKSSDFPVLLDAWQTHAGPGFLVRLTGDGSNALASTYVPGRALSLAVDAAADVIFSGGFPSVFQATPGAQWPCIQPFRDTFGHLSFSPDNRFVAKLDPLGEHLLWGTWVGPSVPAGPAGTDNQGNAVAAGNIPGQRDLTLAVMASEPGPPRVVASCVNQAGSPYLPGSLLVRLFPSTVRDSDLNRASRHR